MINKISTILLGILMVLALGLVFLMPTKAQAAPTVVVDATMVGCTAPTENVDGSTLNDLASYVIYWGTASRNYIGEAPLDVSFCTGSGVPDQPLVMVPVGSWFIAMTALDSAGNESEYSNEVPKDNLRGNASEIPNSPVGLQ